ncbi:MAG: hypothetical protein KHX35_04420, partial [Sutterella wadsworthensis]|nr:hypothetical protein [Sutterella wadsworthensis]
RNFFFIVTPITLTSFTGVNSDVVTGVIYRVALQIFRFGHMRHQKSGSAKNKNCIAPISEVMFIYL